VRRLKCAKNRGDKELEVGAAPVLPKGPLKLTPKTMLRMTSYSQYCLNPAKSQAGPKMVRGLKFWDN